MEFCQQRETFFINLHIESETFTSRKNFANDEIKAFTSLPSAQCEHTGVTYARIIYMMWSHYLFNHQLNHKIITFGMADEIYLCYLDLISAVA